MYSSIRCLSLLSLILSAVQADINGVSSRDIYEEMEHIFLDNAGTNSNGFFEGINPCSKYLGYASDPTNRGEQTAAQWIRTAFHDTITADVAAGTGGLDGSVGYETDRPENLGRFINDTVEFMSSTTFSAYASMADGIALAVVGAVAACLVEKGTATIPLRVGRIDAVEAGPPGAPGSKTDLETTLTRFETAGFNQSDAIVLTACGHTVGRVHYTNNPDVVPESTVTDDNLDGGVTFDTTTNAFDATVVNEYLNGNGSCGGPLVTAPNVIDRSDLRIYASDNNATIRSISSAASFRSGCYALFERLINTVPSTVALSDPIQPMTWKALNMSLDIDHSGTVSISGVIRNLHKTGPPNGTVSYTIQSSRGKSAIQTSQEILGTGHTFLFGNTTYWPFTSTIYSPGTTSLNIENNITYPINDDIFILPKKSSTSGTKVSIAAAALRSRYEKNKMQAVLYVPTSVPGTQMKQIQNMTVSMSQYSVAGDYNLYRATVDAGTDYGIIAKVIIGNTASQTVKVDLF